MRKTHTIRSAVNGPDMKCETNKFRKLTAWLQQHEQDKYEKTNMSDMELTALWTNDNHWTIPGLLGTGT